ncbi:MAG: cell division protein FtsK, partial [Micromonosporaceae bacterium]|nr:cell division protein FtsK [Micromonosporaceae bacterium]
LTEQAAQDALPLATQVVVRNPHALVGDPPGTGFGSGGALNSPVYLDPGPPADTIQQVCAQVAAQLTGGSALSELLPRDLWRERGADGMSCVVGHTGDTPLYLHLAELTPHWLVGGGTGSGKTAFLTNVLYGLSTRYGPDQLRMYLLDLRDGESFTELASGADDPSWVPQAYAVGAAPDREYALAVLEELLAELAERERACADAGVGRYADLPALHRPPRVVCVIDEFPPLLLAEDRIARAALRALETLARKGRGYGIHLVLAARSLRGLESLSGAVDRGGSPAGRPAASAGGSASAGRRDSLFGQFPVRVALPGGGAVLDTRNRAATELSLGTAVVNTAGGLGGPVGAMRAHERLVRFPDPYAEPEALAAVRHRLWASRPAGAGPPHLFTGYEREPVPEPEALPAATTATAYLGRVVDVPQSLAAFPLAETPGRHLAVLGPSEVAADLLHAAGWSLCAAHRPGTVEFMLASFHPATDPVAGALATGLTQAGHRIRRVDAAALKEAIADPDLSNVYIIGFALDTGPSLGLEPLLRQGPQRGVHLFGWWRGLRRFGEDTGGSPEDVAGLVLLNVPAADAAQLLGDPELDWQPQPGRALLRDHHSGQTSVIVPFLGPA